MMKIQSEVTPCSRLVRSIKVFGGVFEGTAGRGHVRDITGREHMPRIVTPEKIPLLGDPATLSCEKNPTVSDRSAILHGPIGIVMKFVGAGMVVDEVIADIGRHACVELVAVKRITIPALASPTRDGNHIYKAWKNY